MFMFLHADRDASGMGFVQRGESSRALTQSVIQGMLQKYIILRNTLRDFIFSIAEFLFFTLKKEAHHLPQLSFLPRCDLNSMNHLHPTFWLNQSFSESKIWINETKIFSWEIFENWNDQEVTWHSFVICVGIIITS